MLIVSQDKEMILNYKNIEAIGIGNPLENDNGNFVILVETISDNQYPIAEYKTEERAKEVLQEIIDTYKGKTLVQFQSILGDKKLNELIQEYGNETIIYDKSAEIKEIKNKLYYMPEK